MKKLCMIVLIIIGAVLAITNPGLDSHKKLVYTSVATDFTKNEALGQVAVDLLGNADVLPLTYNNYYVFSTTTLNDQTASIGVCSKVWKMK